MPSLCVRLSVCLSQAGIVSQLLNVSRKQRHTIGTLVSDATNLGEIRTGLSLTVAPNTGRVG